MSIPTIQGKSPANPIVITESPRRVVATVPPRAPAVSQPSTTLVPNDPRGTKRSIDKMEPDAVERSSQPQIKRARSESASADRQVPALFDAIARGDIDTVKNLLRSQPDLRSAYAPNPAGKTLLCHAAAYGHEELVSFLLKSEEFRDKPSRDGHTPLMYAAMGGYCGVVRILQSSGANPNACSPMNLDSPLRCAIQGRSLEVCKQLIASGANVQQMNLRWLPGGQAPVAATPLLFAIQTDFSELISWLLDAGVIQANYLEPAMNMNLVNAAAFHGAAHTVQELLKRGASSFVRVTLENGKQIEGFLEVAVERSHFHVIEHVLRARLLSVMVVPKLRFSMQWACCLDLFRHRDLWSKPGTVAPDGLSTQDKWRDTKEMLIYLAKSGGEALNWDGVRRIMHQTGWSEIFAMPLRQDKFSQPFVAVLGKNSFKRSLHNAAASALPAQRLSMLIEWMSEASSSPQPFSGLKLSAPTERAMNRMYSLQSELMMSAIAAFRTEFDNQVRKLPWLCMNVFLARSSLFNEPDLYRKMTEEWGLYDPVARAALRLVKEALLKLSGGSSAPVPEERKALSLSDQLGKTMTELLEQWSMPAEFESAKAELGTPESREHLSMLLAQQWRLFEEALGVTRERDWAFGPRLLVLEAELVTDSDAGGLAGFVDQVGDDRRNQNSSAAAEK